MNGQKAKKNTQKDVNQKKKTQKAPERGGGGQRPPRVLQQQGRLKKPKVSTTGGGIKIPKICLEKTEGGGKTKRPVLSTKGVHPPKERELGKKKVGQNQTPRQPRGAEPAGEKGGGTARGCS